VEDAERGREAAVYRRGEASAGCSYEGTPGLQVPATAQEQEPVEEGKDRHFVDWE